MRICTKCNVGTEFHKHGWFCKTCANKASRVHYARHKADPVYKAAKKRAYIKNRHGVSLERYQALLAQQGNKCAICNVDITSTAHYDHNHKTGVFRAFLCTNCNRGLGHFQDSIDLLVTACKYLESHNDSPA